MDMVNTIQGELQQIDTELAELSRRKHDLEITKTVLERVLACGGSEIAPAIHFPQSSRKMSTVECVKTLLRQHPDGLPMSTLVDTLEDQIVSNAANKRRVLQNTVLQLKRAKAVKNVSKGGKSVVVLNE